jgi:hypothetical protein
MNNLAKRIELLANVAIIVVAILLGVVLVKRYVLNSNERASPASARATLAAGDKIPLQGIEWGKNGHTVLLVLQKGCHFCTESAPFYQRLIKETAGRSDVKLIALLPQSVSEGKQYLDEIGVSIADVRQVSPNQVNVGGTPTLIIVDANGVAVNVWKGKLPSEGESQVLSRLNV